MIEIPGFFMEDFFLSMVFYPGVALQMSLTVDETRTTRWDKETVFAFNTLTRNNEIVFLKFFFICIRKKKHF
jgi:hypothetical protein